MTWAIDLLHDERDLDGVLEVEGESFSNPWTRDMYVWELQNRSVCHIFIVRTPECRVAGFCACWLVFYEVHINNVAIRPAYRGLGMGTALLRHVLAEGRRLGGPGIRRRDAQPARVALATRAAARVGPARGHGLSRRL